MSKTVKIWPLLTATQRYEKIVSTRNKGYGQFIESPILSYLIITPNYRILYDVGCDYRKISSPELQAKYFSPLMPLLELPKMAEHQRIPNYLAQLGLTTQDIDLIILSHLHFDHIGGLYELAHCEIHVHGNELLALTAQSDTQLNKGIFADELVGHEHWHYYTQEHQIVPGIHTLNTHGHTAGHTSLLIELSKGPPVILCADAADLMENLADEIAPGYCWQDNENLALESIRKLKTIARSENAELWPGHDWPFFNTLPQFPSYRE